MILYLETSSLVKLYVRESDSDAVRGMVRAADAVATSIIAYAEARAAFARKHRERGISETAFGTVKDSLEGDWPRYFVLGLTDRSVRAAGQLAEKHALRGFDALHLAAAIDLLSSGAPAVRFISADAKLRAAARVEGLETP